jgi:hypothetical protein
MTDLSPAAQAIQTRTYITKSKAGHYTVTVKDLDTRLCTSRNFLATLDQARSLVVELTVELEAFIVDCKTRYHNSTNQEDYD